MQRLAAFMKPTTFVTLVVFVSALFTYAASAYVVGRTHTPSGAQFDQLAESFLHGHLYVTNPRSTADLTMYLGHWYVAFPPLPALLMMPWIAVAGIEHTNTVMFIIGVGATNVMLVFLLLQAVARRGWTRLSLADNVWLTVLFGVGSVQWYMATIGAVWFLGQVCATPFILLAALLAVETGSPVLSGSALAIAMLSRPHTMFTYPLLLGIGLQRMYAESANIDWRRFVRWGLLAGVPIVTVVLLFAGYNYARFGSFSDIGYDTMNVSPKVAGDLHKYGQFSLHYLKTNIWAMLLAIPKWDAVNHVLVPDFRAMSIFLTTPLFLFLYRARRHQPFVIGAWIALALLLIPFLTYYNTGWRQFGYRFSLDFMTPVLVLLAVAMEQTRRWQMHALILVGVLVNSWGVWTFRFFA